MASIESLKRQRTKVAARSSSSGASTTFSPAAHCAESLQRFRELGLTIGGRQSSETHSIPEPTYVGEQRPYGPDLALLRLTEDTVEHVLTNSEKDFYDLERHRDEMLIEEPRLRNGLWGLVGTPGKLCDLTEPSKLVFNAIAYSVGVDEPTLDDDFDYIEVRVALDKPGVLESFGGISGGGLWQAEIQRQDDDFVIVGEPRLEGTVFLQLNPQESEYLYLRCHSRKSIYNKAIAVLQRTITV